MVHSPETKRKISESLKSYGLNPKVRKRRSKLMKKFWKNPEFKKKRQEAIRKASNTIEEKRRRSETNLIAWQKPEVRSKHMGENHPLWQGGSSKEPYSSSWTTYLKESIRKRDGYKCQVCSVPQEKLSRKLDVHHIDYNKKNCSPDNLISLCISCHRNTNKEKRSWIIYFKNKIKKLKRQHLEILKVS